MWNGGLVGGGGIGLGGGEVGFHWKESHRQEWAGPYGKSHSGWGGRRGCRVHGSPMGGTTGVSHEQGLGLTDI